MAWGSCVLRVVASDASTLRVEALPRRAADVATESFDAYYRRDYRSLVGLAFVLTGSHGVAEDLAQDALTEAHKRWSKVGGYDNPGAWVRHVMVNKSTSRFRRLRSEAKSMTRLRARPTEVIEPTERSAEVWTAVRSLPTRQAQAIALFYWEDLSVAEIGEILGTSTETAKTHLKRGRAALAQSLESFRGEAS